MPVLIFPVIEILPVLAPKSVLKLLSVKFSVRVVPDPAKYGDDPADPVACSVKLVPVKGPPVSPLKVIELDGKAWKDGAVPTPPAVRT